tara:strand:+ start:34 stop:405 length:372 start_codon:yes stop_codon:yes gene_type:complete
MTTISKRIIGIPETQINREALHQNPTFGIHNVSSKRYQNKDIFKVEENTPSIIKRIGMSIDTNLIAQPCESVNDRMGIRTGSGFRNDPFSVEAGNGLSAEFFTNDRLGFTSDVKQKPTINKIY